MMLLQAVLPLLVGPERGQAPVFELRRHILRRHHIYLTIFLNVLILSRLLQTVCKDLRMIRKRTSILLGLGQGLTLR